MRDGMQVTWRGRIGPATLSKPEVMGASEVSAQEEYESGAGRKVPRPSEQVRQAALRGLGLKAQAKNRSLRDKVVRGGGVKKKRQIDPSYKILSARSVPQWGETNVSLVGDSSDALTKGAAAKGGLAGIGDWFKSLVATPKPMAPKPPGVPGAHVPGGVESWKKFRKGLKTPTGPRAPKASETPITQKKFQSILQQQKAVEADPLAVAQQQGMRVGPWAKIVSNPMGSMLMQMAAMSAIEPIMYGLGIRSPILGGILPFMAMQQLPGLLEGSAGIPRLQQTLGRMAERGKLKMPVAAPQAAVPQPAQPMGLAKTGCVAIPRITTVFG
jgi:hypothetical protein